MMLEQLESRGVRLEQVTAVLITPLTVYTTGNLNQFPNAKVYISKRGWIDFQTPDPFSHQLPRSIVMPGKVQQYFTGPGWSKLCLLGEEEQVIDGIKAKWVGTHHRSSMAFVVDTSIGRVALTDCVFKYPNLEQHRPLGIQESMEECLRAYDWLRREVDLVIRLYDPEVFVRFPGGRIG